MKVNVGEPSHGKREDGEDESGILERKISTYQRLDK